MQKLLGPRLVIGIVFVAVLVAMSLFVGQYDILGADDGWEMFATTRIPYTVALMLSGAATAMCGLVMQLLTHNKFVESTTMGTTEWAGLDLIFVMYLFPSVSLLGQMSGVTIFAFIDTTVFFLFLRRVTLKSGLVVPIVDIMLGAVVGSISTSFTLQTDMLQSLNTWFADSFTDTYKGQCKFLWLIITAVAIVFVFSDRLTVTGLDEDIAVNVGLNYKRIVFLDTGLIAIATSLVTIVVGNLPFLSPIVPSVVSMFRDDDLHSNLPWVCLVGIGTVTIADLVDRVIIVPFEISVLVILGILGAAIFVYLIVERRRA